MNFVWWLVNVHRQKIRFLVLSIRTCMSWIINCQCRDGSKHVITIFKENEPSLISYLNAILQETWRDLGHVGAWVPYLWAINFKFYWKQTICYCVAGHIPFVGDHMRVWTWSQIHSRLAQIQLKYVWRIHVGSTKYSHTMLRFGKVSCLTALKHWNKWAICT